MSASIETALVEIRGRWKSATVSTRGDGQGNTVVTVDGLDIGPNYDPRMTWVAFTLMSNYPDPDVYPHFMAADLRRVDGQPLGEGFATNQWLGNQVTQVSRRTADWNGAVDTAEGKLTKVLDFVRSRP